MKELRGEREKRADGRRFRRRVAKKRKPRATRGLVRGIDDDTPSRHTEYIYSIYEENHGNRFYHSCHANDADWDALSTRI